MRKDTKTGGHKEQQMDIIEVSLYNSVRKMKYITQHWGMHMHIRITCTHKDIPLALRRTKTKTKKPQRK